MNDSNLPSLPEPEPLPQKSGDDQALVPHKTDWLHLAQFGFSLLAGILLLGVFTFSTLGTLFRDTISPQSGAGSSDLSPYLFAAGMGFAGLLMIPSALSSGKALFGKQPPKTLPWERVAWMRLSLPAALVLGVAAQYGPPWSRGFLPLFHVIANGAGVLWLLDIARRRLPDQSPSRVSGTVVCGLALTPLITFTLEVLLLLGFVLLAMLAVQVQPGFRQELLDLGTRLQRSPVDLQLLRGPLERIAARPGVIASIFLYLGILVPLVEELLKPLAVWLLLGRKLQPWEGFVIGAGAGAGYALFENLTIGAQVDAWTFVTVSRLGTAAVHIFTTGLVGWGLASAFTERNFRRLAGAFLGAVVLHGFWNGLNILYGLSDFAPVREVLGPIGAGVADFAPAGLILLSAGALGGLLKANKYFRRAIMAQIS